MSMAEEIKIEEFVIPVPADAGDDEKAILCKALVSSLKLGAQKMSTIRDLTKQIHRMHALNVDMFLLYLGMALTCMSFALEWAPSVRTSFNAVAAGVVIGRWISRWVKSNRDREEGHDERRG